MHKAGHEAFLVGGCVRDLIRGIEPEDHDIVTSARPAEVQSLFSHTISVGVSFGVIVVIEDGHRHEVATFRAESDYTDGRRPSTVTFASAKQDVLRRDFTINGLLLDVGNGRIIDYVDGLADIKQKVIRTIGEADLRFSEDHLRMLRAIRLAANLNFTITPDTFSAIKKNAGAICRVSAERIRDELTSFLTRGGARQGIEMLAASGLLKEILPEVNALRGVEQPPRFHPEGDVWEHTLRMLAVMTGSSDGPVDPQLAWGVLLHDIGKPPTRFEDGWGVHFHGHVQKGEQIASDILQRLRFSNKETGTILALVHYHMHFMNVREMRPNRLKRFLRMLDFPLHLELHRLDCIGSHRLLDNYNFCKEKLSELAIEDLHPPRLLTGHDLIDMGFPPGPVFKEILSGLEDAQLEGDISTREEARWFVINHWGENYG
ncbi:MAG: CCA tRNA nucleotidyltransferase [Deltaproteobacteria bacterium]|nr:CCA tRNA nucleotidyltransferase [Deltaproteobacteria bacterium]